jgi:hypothetical protein
MAESSGFFGSTAGDRKYTSTQMSEFMATITENASGVVRNFANTLALTSNGAGGGVVNTGRAVHLGRWYINTASVTKTLSAVTINNKRRDRFVIRFDAVTARSGVVTVINGVETTGTPAAPAIGADDVLIGYIESYNNAGVYAYTATDERVYAFDSKIQTEDIVDLAVTTGKINDLSVTTGKIAADSVTNAKMADNAIGTAELIDDCVTNAELANMAQTTVKGRASGAGTGDPVDLTAAQLVTIINTADGSGSGLDADTVRGFTFSTYINTSALGSNYQFTAMAIGEFRYFSFSDTGAYTVISPAVGTCAFFAICPNSIPTTYAGQTPPNSNFVFGGAQINGWILRIS